MKHLTLALLILAVPFGAAAQPDTDAQSKAEAALHSGVPQGAIAPLKEALSKGQGNRTTLTLLLARLQLASGHPDDALKTLDAADNHANTEWKLLRAAALAAQGATSAATTLLNPLAASNAEAALLLARIHAEQGDRNLARQVLAQAPPDAAKNPHYIRLMLDLALSAEDTHAAEKLLDTITRESLLPEAEVNTAKGRLHLLQRQPTEAAAAFSSALTAGNASTLIRDNARLGLARTAVLSGDNKKAREILHEALVTGTTPATLRQTMEDWIAVEKSLGADPTGDLRSWSAKKESQRGTEATLQLARLDLDARGPEAALDSLQKLLGDTNLGPEDRQRAELLAAEAKIAAGQYAEALPLLDGLPGEDAYAVAMLRGRALAAEGSNRQAHEAFSEALQNAKTNDEKYAAAADRFLTALAAGDLNLARSSLQTLREAAPDHPRLLEWLFLFAAAEAQKGEIDDLSILAHRSPSTDYAFQAKLALAEWRLARGEGVAAERILKTARAEASTPPRAATLASAEIFAADNSGSKTRDELVAECRQFLSQYPDSPEAADVAFKLAELYSRGGDHSAAESVLAKLASTLPGGESAALARFLAAGAASRSMSDAAADRALVWFDELAQGQSRLRYRARLEQASLLLRQRKFSDALALQESILASDPPPEIRRTSAMERGDILFALSASDPATLEQAAAAYELVAADKDAPPDWRDQALCKRAAALAQLGQTDKALALYREILDRPPVENSDQFWFFKAGLDAGRLLEEQKDWPAAVVIYDRLAAAGGAQREELQQRARRLRLEHFIWEN